MTRENASLRLESVAIELRGRTIIEVDIEIAPGEIVTITGPSGSGKSTLLAFVAGFIAPAFATRGRVRLGGRDITDLSPERRHVGLLFQDALLFPHMSVGQNLLFAVSPRHSTRNERRRRAESALEQAGMAGFFDSDPATLSGGQKTRTALMRVLLSEPRSLLLDEPFTGLDPERRQKIREFVFREARSRGLPVLLVTHDREDARHAGGAIVELR